MSKPICVVAYPRSGSTLFMELLSHIEDVRVLYEIFHTNEAFAEQEMGGLWAQAKTLLEARGEAVTLLELKRCPMRQLRALTETVDGQEIAFKIFPKHLQRQTLDNLLSKVTPVFVYRNLLESWISGRIAKVTGCWGGADTSDFLVEFDPESFVCKALFFNRFIRFSLASCSDRNQPWLWYDYIDFQDAEAFLPLLGRDLSLFRNCHIPEIKPLQLSIQKQDTRKSPLEKLSNPNAAKEWLIRWEMTALLDPNIRQDFTRMAGWVEMVAERNSWNRPKSSIRQPLVSVQNSVQI